MVTPRELQIERRRIFGEKRVYFWKCVIIEKKFNENRDYETGYLQSYLVHCA